MKIATAYQSSASPITQYYGATSLAAARPLVMALDRRWIPAMLQLQADHGDDQVVHRSEADLEQHFAAGHTAMGAFLDGRLAGQALLTTETLQPGDLKSMFARAAGVAASAPVTASTISGVIVAGEARGNGIMGKLVSAWAHDAQSRDCDLLRAWVRVGNAASLNGFLKQRLAVTNIGASPNQATHDVYTLLSPAHGGFAVNAFSTARVDAIDAPGISDRLQQGYVGTGLNKSGQLTMSASRGLTL